MSILTAEQRVRWAASTGLAEWSDEKVDYLCELVSQDYSFPQIGAALGVSANAAKSRFARVRNSYGWQGE